MEHREWKGTTAGTGGMHRSLIRALQVLPLGLVYLGAAVFVIPFCMIFAHKGYLSIYHFFRHRMGYGVWKSFLATYRNHVKFAEIIIDRFYMYGGGTFEFDIENYDRYLQLARQQGGFVILSAHVGNYEAAGYTLVASDKPFNALVYGGEVETVMENRERIFSAHRIHMIPVSKDMSHLFAMSNALSEGEVVSIPGDRIFGSPRHVTCQFMGAEAKFPLGPFALAVQREVPVLTVMVMKESRKKYRIMIHELAAVGENNKEKVQHLAQQFASCLEDTVDQYPTQWFNYYEFWD